MTMLTPFRGSLMLGLFLASGLSVACGSSASAGDGGGSQAGESPAAHGGGPGSAPSAGGGGGAPLASGGGGAPLASGGSPGSAGGSAVGLGGSGVSSSGSAGAGGSSAGAGAGGSSVAGSGGSSGGGMAGGTALGKTEYAPYYEIGSGTNAFSNLVDLKAKAGVSNVTLAFVLSGGGCSTDKTVNGELKDIQAFVAAGGHVKASFGGQAGTYVESGCSDAASLAGAISKFVDDTGITDLDFDIEQKTPLTDAMDTMRGQALKMVQDSKHIQVSFTLEIDTDGLPAKSISCLMGAIKAGVTVTHLNAMVMDFGDNPGKPLAPIAIAALNTANGQLKKAIPSLTDAQAWAMLGATPDIGQNDDDEVFSLADAQALTDFAIEHKLGLVTFWNIQRDQVCGKGECSQFDKANFDYSHIFEKVAK